VAYSEDGKTVITADIAFTRIWDTHTGKLVRVIEGIGDMDRLAEVPRLNSTEAFVRGIELVIEGADGKELAWLPNKFKILKASTDGRTLAAAEGSHLHLYTLEGGDRRESGSSR
jgi:hypothetical protein